MRKEGIQNSQLIRRLKVIPFFCVTVFSILAGRVVIVSLFSTPHDGSMLEAPPAVTAARPPQELVLPSIKRATITDRNGQPLAISLPMAQLYANPREIYSPPEVAKILKKTLPALDLKETRERLSQPRQFVYLARNLTLEEEKKINNLVTPGFYF